MNDYESVSLDLWILDHPSEEEMKKVFLNMDIAMKYIHEHGYCIETFYPSEIEILNNELDHIQFKKLIELSHDPSIRKNMIQEDIFNSALMQIGMYFYSEDLGLTIHDILKNLTPTVIKDNFDAYTQFIPNDDIPYYRGVIMRNASVYLFEFIEQKNVRELEQLEKELGEEKDNSSKQLYMNKRTNYNNRINDSIYRQINGLKDAAFINTLIIPTIILVVGIIVALIFWLMSIF